MRISDWSSDVCSSDLAAVVARPDAKWGESPCAFVTLREGESATAEEIVAFCRDMLARYKVPRSVVFGPLPKTSTGKIQKFVLRDRAAGLCADPSRASPSAATPPSSPAPPAVTGPGRAADGARECTSV